MSIIVLAVALLLSAAVAASAQNDDGDPRFYHYHPNNVLALGRGFSPNDVTESKIPCIVAEQVPLDPGAPKTQIRARYVRSFEEFSNAASFDLKVEASGLSYSGSAHFNIDQSSLQQSNSISVVINATTEYGRWALKAPVSLTTDAQKLLKHPRDFALVCGTRYVAMEQRASSAGVVVSIFNASQNTRSAFQAEASANYDGIALSVKASAAFKNELKKALKQDRVDLQVFATGGAGFGDLSGVIKGLAGTPDPLESITTGLADFMKKFSKENAAITTYSVESMDKLGWDPNSIDPWTDLKESRLRQIVKEYRLITEELSNFDDAIAGGRWLSVEPRARSMLNWRPKVEGSRKRLAELHRKCKQSQALADCEVPSDIYHFESEELPSGGELLSFVSPPPPTINFEIHPHCYNPVTRIASRFGCDPTKPDRPILEGNRSRAVLSAPQQIRLNVLRTFDASAEMYFANAVLQGHHLDIQRVVFAGNDGEQPVTAYGPAGGFIWDRGPEQLPDYAFLLIIERFMKGSSDGEHEGTFLLQVKDKLGRTFNLPLADAKFTVVSSNVTNSQLDYVY
jgi:hypothetical protein